MSTHERDLIGYGQHPPQAHWPNDARVAVSIVINYEEGSERTVLNGDGESEYYLTELPAVPRPSRNPSSSRCTSTAAASASGACSTRSTRLACR